MNKPQLWTKDFWVISFLTLFTNLSFYLLLVIIPIYTMDTFRSSPSISGLASGIFVIGALISRLFLGKWIELIGRRRMLYAGLIFYLVMTALYFEANSLILLLAVRFFHGAAFGISTTAMSAIAANIIPSERRGEGMAYYTSVGITLSSAIGPFLGMFLRQYSSYQMVFLVCTIFAALSLVMIFVLFVPEIKLTEEQLHETKKFKMSGIFATKAIPISLIAGLIYFSYSSVLSFLSPYAEEINMVESASIFFIVYSAAILISRPIVGRLFDLKGENVVMYPAFMLIVLGLITLSQAHNEYVLLASAILIGLGMGTHLSSGQTIAIKVVPKHQTGLAMSTYFSFMDVGTGIGPYVFGIFVPLVSYSGAYLIAAIPPLACVFIYYLLHGKKAVHVKAYSK